MDIKFKRSLIGYNPAQVTEKLIALDQEFSRKYSDLQQVLTDQVHDRDLLKAEVDRLRHDLAAKATLQDEIAQRLVFAHLNATRKVIEAINDAEQSEAKIANLIGAQKWEMKELRLSANNLSDEFLTLIRYQTMFGLEE